MLKEFLGRKIGMTQIYDKTGAVIPVTIIEAGPCYVTAKIEGRNAVQIGFGKVKKASKPLLGHLKKAGIEQPLKYFKETKAEKPEEISLGQEIKVDVFKAGEKVDVRGFSIGKGFQGTIKRHHFMRSHMTHGSKSHRIPGSIGAGTTPGRVLKGKKMAGRMGAEFVTVRNLTVVDVDAEKNILILKGAVPGVEGGLLEIKKKK